MQGNYKLIPNVVYILSSEKNPLYALDYRQRLFKCTFGICDEVYLICDITINA